MQMLDIAGLRAHTTSGFLSALAEVGVALGLDPSYLAGCMAIETGHTFSPSIKNPYTGAVGLIQFMPATAAAMGTSTDQLGSLSATDQLAYVKRYFEPYAGRIRFNVPGDYYLAVFMPAYIGQSPDTVIFSSGQTGYAENAGLDRNGDGLITVGDVTSTIEAVVADALSRPPIDVTVGSSVLAWAFGTAVAVLVGAALYQRRGQLERFMEAHAHV